MSKIKQSDEPGNPNKLLKAKKRAVPEELVWFASATAE
jgi:hypothetical protein